MYLVNIISQYQSFPHTRKKGTESSKSEHNVGNQPRPRSPAALLGTRAPPAPSQSRAAAGRAEPSWPARALPAATAPGRRLRSRTAASGGVRRVWGRPPQSCVGPRPLASLRRVWGRPSPRSAEPGGVLSLGSARALWRRGPGGVLPPRSAGSGRAVWPGPPGRGEFPRVPGPGTSPLLQILQPTPPPTRSARSQDKVKGVWPHPSWERSLSVARFPMVVDVSPKSD